MALRSGYKGFKKVINGLKVFRPGVLGLDLGTGLAIDANGKLKVTGDLKDYAPNINANTQLISDSIWGESGKNLMPFHSQTINGKVFVADGDGYLTCANTDDRAYEYANSNEKFQLKAGTYKVRIFQKTAKTEGYTGLVIMDSSGTSILSKTSTDAFNTLITEGAIFNLANDTDIGVMIKVGNGSYALMIYPANILDPAYEPYHESAVKLFASKFIECDKTAAGTYTLSATVDAQGAITYAWTAVTP